MPSRRRKKTLAALDRAAEALLPCRVAGGFPQLAVRYIAAIYAVRAVHFTLDPLHLGDGDGAVFGVLDPDPDAGEPLTPARRQAVLDAAESKANALQLSVCAAFSRYDLVYFWPGKPPIASSRYPRAGALLYDVVQRRAPGEAD